MHEQEESESSDDKFANLKDFIKCEYDMSDSIPRPANNSTP